MRASIGGCRPRHAFDASRRWDYKVAAREFAAVPARIANRKQNNGKKALALVCSHLDDRFVGLLTLDERLLGLHGVPGFLACMHACMPAPLARVRAEHCVSVSAAIAAAAAIAGPNKRQQSSATRARRAPFINARARRACVPCA